MTTLAHKERTLQDIIDEMTPEQRELMDLIVGAAVEDEEIEDDDIVAQAEALPLEIRQLIDFVVGGIISKEDNKLAQSNLIVDDFLAHFGVKGMKWGVRRDRSGGGSSYSAPRGSSMNDLAEANTKSNRSAARAKVRAGTATAQDAHVAALKSTGHRVANVFLGDKSYWRGMAITAGVAGGVAGAAIAAPALLPASVLGVTASAAVTSTGVGTAVVGAQISSAVLQVSNVVRAVQGNSRIYESYAQLGNNIASNYQAGLKRTAKILRKDGGLSSGKTKKLLAQSEGLRVGQFLEHHSAVSLRTIKSGD